MKRLTQSLSRTKDGAFIIDDRYRIIFWNRAAEEILGYTAQEVMGMPCYKILGGRDKQGHTLCQRFCWAVVRAERGETLPSRDVYTHTHTGEGRWLNVTTFAYPVRDNGMAQAIIHIFRDVTEQKNYRRFVDSVLAASERLQQKETNPISLSTPVDTQLDKLTVREQQVLELLAQGLGTGEIAATLIITPSTARNHVQNILGKLGAHSRLEAIAFAYQHGLIASNSL